MEYSRLCVNGEKIYGIKSNIVSLSISNRCYSTYMNPDIIPPQLKPLEQHPHQMRMENKTVQLDDATTIKAADPLQVKPSDTEFREWGKIYRYSRECVITEKIDGSNAQILFLSDGTFYAGSRNRWLDAHNDNFGFYNWVSTHHEELFALLGVGRHYGEWWGNGIQRGYGKKGKCFSLFNVSKWGFMRDPGYIEKFGKIIVGGVEVSSVPVISTSAFGDDAVFNALNKLKDNGSLAAPGFMQPEGIVVYHKPSHYLFKKTIENDENGKGE